MKTENPENKTSLWALAGNVKGAQQGQGYQEKTRVDLGEKAAPAPQLVID